jgi:protein TonB
MCSDKPIAPIWHDSWADFSDEEKKTTLDEIQSYIKIQVGEALSTVNLWGSPAQNAQAVTNEHSEAQPKRLLPHTNARMDPQYPLKIGAPYYPRESLRAKEQGRCIVSVTVAANGWLKGASIQQSTGYPRLDQACLDAVAGGHLIPATENGIPIEKTIALPMVWSLNR